LTTPTVTGNSFYKIEDYPQAQWHYGAGRVVTGHSTNGSTTISLSPGQGFFDCTPTCAASHDLNHPISGYQASKALDTLPSCIPPFAFIAAVTTTTTAVMNLPATCTSGGTVPLRDWLIENSDSRSCVVTDTAGSTTVTGAKCDFQPSDVGRAIICPGIPHGTTILSRVSTTTIVVNHAATTSNATARCLIGPAANQTTSRFVHDCHTNGSTTITSAGANFQIWDWSLPIAGTNIANGTYIKSVTNATTVILSAPTTGTTTTGSCTIGAPNANAPALDADPDSPVYTAGDTLGSLDLQFDVNPMLVIGQDSCSANTADGVVLTMGWQNPGSTGPNAKLTNALASWTDLFGPFHNAYLPAGTFGVPTDVSLKYPTITQLLVPTSVLTFAGYVEQIPANAPGESNTAAHYDIVFPVLPTSLAVCTSNAVGAAISMEFQGTTHGQTSSPIGPYVGTGIPFDAMARQLKDITTASVTSSAYFHVRTNDSAAVDTFTFTQPCTESYPSSANFACGTG
jgi:hypothetical protein